MTLNRRPISPPDTSAEMLELIAKVTASISDRMDGQDHAIEEIRLLGREANAQIIDRMPHTVQDMDGMRRKVSESARAASNAQQVAEGAEYRIGQLRQQFEEAEGEAWRYRQAYGKERHKLKIWICGTLALLPFFAILVAIILPPLLGHYPATCGAMGGTWHVENGRAYCYFVKLAD